LSKFWFENQKKKKKKKQELLFDHMATQPERNKAAFTEGIHLALSTWTVLTLAVEEEFGGPDSREKAEWLVGVVISIFETSKKKT